MHDQLLIRRDCILFFISFFHRVSQFEIRATSLQLNRFVFGPLLVITEIRNRDILS